MVHKCKSTILTPLAGNAPQSVKNSSAFVERVGSMELEAVDCLVSFDVTNLFTQVPVDEALSHQTLPTLNLCTRAQQSHRGS